MRAGRFPIWRYQPVARKLAGGYGGAHKPFEELLQVASLGSMKAIDRLDQSRGTLFSQMQVSRILRGALEQLRELTRPDQRLDRRSAERNPAAF